MTPAERAAGVVQDYYAKRMWGYDPVQHAEYEGLIAAAIREAVAEERERCAKIVEQQPGVMSMDDTDAPAIVANAIRSGVEPQ